MIWFHGDRYLWAAFHLKDKVGLITKVRLGAKFLASLWSRTDRWKFAQSVEGLFWREWAPKYYYEWARMLMKHGCQPGVEESKPVSQENCVNLNALCKELDIEPRDDGVVIDLGCGPSGIGYAIDSAGSVVCVDPLMHEYKRMRFYREEFFERLKGPMFCSAAGENIPVRDCVADLIFCINVLDHCHNPDVILGEVARILRPQGFLILDVASWTGEPAWMMDPCHPSQMTYDSLQAMLTGHGFKVKRSDFIREAFEPPRLYNRVLLSLQRAVGRKSELGDALFVAFKP